MMRLCEKHSVPFYLENPQRSKLWCHPLIVKWVRNKLSHKVQFDYCQFGTTWRKATSVLAFGNRDFNQSVQRKCRETWNGKKSICSRTGIQHELLAGFAHGKQNGQYKTNKACPYPHDFCEYVAPILSKPARVVGPALAAGPVVSMEKQPDDHYLCHLPKQRQRTN